MCNDRELQYLILSICNDRQPQYFIFSIVPDENAENISHLSVFTKLMSLYALPYKAEMAQKMSSLLQNNLPPFQIHEQ